MAINTLQELQAPRAVDHRRRYGCGCDWRTVKINRDSAIVENNCHHVFAGRQRSSTGTGAALPCAAAKLVVNQSRIIDIEKEAILVPTVILRNQIASPTRCCDRIEVHRHFDREHRPVIKFQP